MADTRCSDCPCRWGECPHVAELATLRQQLEEQKGVTEEVLGVDTYTWQETKKHAQQMVTLAEKSSSWIKIGKHESGRCRYWTSDGHGPFAGDLHALADALGEKP